MLTTGAGRSPTMAVASAGSARRASSCRAAALSDDQRSRPEAVQQAMLAHLCRCTGWQTVVESVVGVRRAARARPADPSASSAPRTARGRGGAARRSARRARAGGFADDRAPADALVAVRRDRRRVGGRRDAGRGPAPRAQRCRAGARRVPLTWPLEVPAGRLGAHAAHDLGRAGLPRAGRVVVRAGRRARSPLANGGAFGGKVATRGRSRRPPSWPTSTAVPVRVIATREDVVRHGPKRPPIAAGVRADGTRCRPRGADARHRRRDPPLSAPALEVVEVDVAGPPTSAALRGAGWAEAAVLLASLADGPEWRVRAPSGATAAAVDRR